MLKELKTLFKIIIKQTFKVCLIVIILGNVTHLFNTSTIKKIQVLKIL